MIMKEHNYFKDSLWNKSESTYTFETGSKIEFFSVDQPDKLRGARRDRLFINECNNVPFDAFEQLEVRTKDFVFLDYNPTNEFWAITELNQRNDLEKIILTYKDNEALSQQIIDSIEQRRNRKNWWKVYGLGELGEIEGKVYTDWQIIDDIPHNARLERRGMDFGFTNDPTAIVDIYYYDGGYIWDEQCYQRGLLNKPIADLILSLPVPQTLVVADSAEPRTIAEISSYGVNIIGVGKHKGETKSETFKKWSTNLVKSERISVTKRSINIIREYRNYLWEVDRDGKILNVTEHQFSHSMNAGEYGMASIKDRPTLDLKQFTSQFSSREQNSAR